MHARQAGRHPLIKIRTGGSSHEPIYNAPTLSGLPFPLTRSISNVRHGVVVQAACAESQRKSRHRGTIADVVCGFLFAQMQ